MNKDAENIVGMITDALDDVEYEAEYVAENLISDVCPYMDSETKTLKARNLAKELRKECQDNFDRLETAVEEKFAEYSDDKEDLEAKLADANELIEQREETIDDLQGVL